MTEPMHAFAVADLRDRLRLFRDGLFCCLSDALVGWELEDGTQGTPDDAVDLGEATYDDMETVRSIRCQRAECENCTLEAHETLPALDPATGEEQV